MIQKKSVKEAVRLLCAAALVCAFLLAFVGCGGSSGAKKALMCRSNGLQPEMLQQRL